MAMMRMKRWMQGALAIALAGGGAGCDPRAAHGGSGVSLAEARQGFETTILEKRKAGVPAPDPPADLFEKVRYPSEVGDLVAYVAQESGGQCRHRLQEPLPAHGVLFQVRLYPVMAITFAGIH